MPVVLRKHGLSAREQFMKKKSIPIEMRSIRNEMSDEEFERMMSVGLAQATNDESYDADEAFA